MAPILAQGQAGEERADDEPHQQDGRDQAGEDAQHPRQCEGRHVGAMEQAGGDHIAGQDEEAVERQLYRRIDKFRPDTVIGQAHRDQDGVGIDNDNREDDPHGGECVRLVFEPAMAGMKDRTHGFGLI